MPDTYFMDRFSEDDVFINRVPVLKTSLHDHEFVEIALVEQGRGYHRIGDTVLEVSEGDYFIIDRKVMHRFSSDDGNMIICNCIFTPRFLDLAMIGIDNFRQMTSHYPYTDLAVRTDTMVPEFRFRASGPTLALFREMYQEYTKKQPGYLRVLQADIQKLVVLSLRQLPLYRVNLPAGAEETYQKILHYIRYHFDRPITLEQLAGMAYVSPEHFSRQFKRATGKTVMDFLREVRIEEAGKLLMETDLSLDEIAQRVGYHDTRHFARLFRQQKGMPPIHYRKVNRISSHA